MTDMLNENMNEEIDVISLTDEDGNETEFEYIDVFEYKNEEYAVLLPLEDDGTGEVVILLVEEEDGMETFSSVEEVEVLEAVFELFREKYKEEFNFED
jgi:uncharacterized protein YrzB (UPF0473 family)